MDERRAAEGVEHLQSAARELIGAARAFLDVVEEVVEDRDRLSGAAATVTDLVRGGLDLAGRSPDPWAAPEPARRADTSWWDEPYEDDAEDGDGARDDLGAGSGSDPAETAPAAKSAPEKAAPKTTAPRKAASKKAAPRKAAAPKKAAPKRGGAATTASEPQAAPSGGSPDDAAPSAPQDTAGRRPSRVRRIAVD